MGVESAQTCINVISHLQRITQLKVVFVILTASQMKYYSVCVFFIRRCDSSVLICEWWKWGQFLTWGLLVKLIWLNPGFSPLCVTLLCECHTPQPLSYSLFKAGLLCLYKGEALNYFVFICYNIYLRAHILSFVIKYILKVTFPSLLTACCRTKCRTRSPLSPEYRLRHV